MSFHFCKVGFLHGFLAHLRVEPGKGFTTARKKDDPTDGLIETVDGMEENISLFFEFLFEEGFGLCLEIGSIGGRGLGQKAGGFVHSQEVVIQIKNIKCVGGGLHKGGGWLRLRH